MKARRTIKSLAKRGDKKLVVLRTEIRSLVLKKETRSLVVLRTEIRSLVLKTEELKR